MTKNRTKKKRASKDKKYKQLMRKKNCKIILCKVKKKLIIIINIKNLN